MTPSITLDVPDGASDVFVVIRYGVATADPVQAAMAAVQAAGTVSPPPPRLNPAGLCDWIEDASTWPHAFWPEPDMHKAISESKSKLRAWLLFVALHSEQVFPSSAITPTVDGHVLTPDDMKAPLSGLTRRMHHRHANLARWFFDTRWTGVEMEYRMHHREADIVREHLRFLGFPA